MDHATFVREAALNRQAYARLREQIQREHVGKYVALARGQVVGATNSFDGARALVEELDPMPEYYLVFPANSEPDFNLVYDLAGSV
jgi:hypothetical protein